MKCLSTITCIVFITEVIIYYYCLRFFRYTNKILVLDDQLVQNHCQLNVTTSSDRQTGSSLLFSSSFSSSPSSSSSSPSPPPSLFLLFLFLLRLLLLLPQFLGESPLPASNKYFLFCCFCLFFQNTDKTKKLTMFTMLSIVITASLVFQCPFDQQVYSPAYVFCYRTSYTDISIFNNLIFQFENIFFLAHFIFYRAYQIWCNR